RDPPAGRAGYGLPLVRGGRARLGALDAAAVVLQRPARSRPQAERAVDVQPGLVSGRDVGNRVDRIERSGVHVARLRADNRWTSANLAAVERGGERVRPYPSLIVGRSADDLTRADPEHPQRADYRHVHFVADDDAQQGRALQTVRLDIPAGAAQQLVTCRRERREVRHVAARDEADAG